MKNIKSLLMALATVFGLITFTGCDKNSYYDGDNIDDILAIKELLKDVDCEKGVIINYKNNSSYNVNSGSDIMYCADLQAELSDVDEFYKSLGSVSSVAYDKKKKSVVIKSVKKFQTYYRIDYYNVVWYWVTQDRTTTFYTKGSH